MFEPTLFSTRKLNEILELYQMHQLLNNPTRVTEFTKSLFDEYITSNPENIIYSSVLHLGISDHSLIYAIRRLMQNQLLNHRAMLSLEISKNLRFQTF